MIQATRNYLVFLGRCARIAFVGDWRYYAWMGLLTFGTSGLAVAALLGELSGAPGSWLIGLVRGAARQLRA